MVGLGTAWRMAVGLALAVAAGAQARAEPIRDWPCEQPFAEHLSAEQVWGGPLPGPLPADWQADPAVREVVAFAADPENPPSRGADEIAAFTARLGSGRDEALLGAFAGLLEEFDTLRAIAVGGVRDFVVRAKIIDESVAAHGAELAALPADGGDAVDARRKGLVEARFWDERNLDDALDEAEFLCHRYEYLGEKLRRLTAALREAF